MYFDDEKKAGLVYFEVSGQEVKTSCLRIAEDSLLWSIT